MHDATAYLAQLIALLPRGRLWESLARPGTVFHKLLDALAQEFARIDARAADLLDELDPRKAVELLEEWEEFVGLPDACAAAPETLAERQGAAHARLVAIGSQTLEHLHAVAAALGVTITLRHYHPRRHGDPFGALYSGQDWQWIYDIVAPAATPASTRTLLECEFRRLERAHRYVRFFYE